MSCKTLAIIVVFFFGYCHVNARVFYVNEPVNSQRESYLNPIYPNEPSEQASRDLDLSFSVGDPSENSDNRDIYVVKKVYTQENPDRSVHELNYEYERPVAYYKVAETPAHRNVYGDQFPVAGRNRKVMKLNNEQHKGEIVLELRVIANNNNNPA